MNTLRASVLLTLLVTYLISTACSFAEGAERPNVILILVDDLGWRDWSGAGNEICVTPNLDRLSAEGMTFTQSYAACAVCSPTRAAVQTGRYPARVGVTDWIRSRFQRPGGQTPDKNPTEYVGGRNRPMLCPPNPFWMESDEKTIAEYLTPAGYRTAYIGKWHLGDEDWFPERQGYQVNFGGCDYGQPPNYFDPFNQPKGKHESLRAGIYNLPGRKSGEYLTDRETDEACKLIRAWKDEPFFIQLAHYAVHTPLQAPKPDVLKYSRDGVSKQQATYAAMVESVDRAVAQLRTTLEETGLANNTVIWFTSDNGGLDTKGNPTENHPLRAGKGFPYEGGIRIPTIIHWPQAIPQPATSNTPICSIDILPTIADWCQIELDENRPIDGVSLAQHIASGGNSGMEHRPLLWHFPHYRGSILPYSILRQGEYKLLRYYGGPTELFNLNSDPGEETDLASEETARVTQMSEELDRLLSSMGAKIPKLNPTYQP